MKTLSHEMDLKDVIREVEEIFSKRDLKEKLFALALIDRIPTPDELVKEAIKSIRQHPLSSLFGTSHHDSEGKVIHRSAGSGFGDGEDNSAVRQRNRKIPNQLEEPLWWGQNSKSAGSR